MFILDADFMRIAFATGAVVGVLAPAVGFFLVQRQMSLIGDGIGHAAFAGVAAGYLFGVSPVGAALVAATLAAVSVEWLRSRHRAAGDQALALIFYTGIAAGVVLVSAAGALNANLFSFLFGSILTVTWSILRSSRCSEPWGSGSSRCSIAGWSPWHWTRRERASAGFRSGS